MRSSRRVSVYVECLCGLGALRRTADVTFAIWTLSRYPIIREAANARARAVGKAREPPRTTAQAVRKGQAAPKAREPASTTAQAVPNAEVTKAPSASFRQSLSLA
jgi:hypothetical protein